MKIKLFIFLLLFFTQSVYAAEVDNLFSAAILGKTKRVKALLADGVDVNGITTPGRTAMMAASFSGNLRVVRILLAYGADVNIADNLGSTALMDAVVFGREKLVKLLITAGADVNAVDKQNISVIEKAKKTKNSNIVKILENESTAQQESDTPASADEATDEDTTADK
jgi:ankyrin repeat protein